MRLMVVGVCCGFLKVFFRLILLSRVVVSVVMISVLVGYWIRLVFGSCMSSCISGLCLLSVMKMVLLIVI